MIHLLNWLRWGLIVFLIYVAALMKEEQEGRWENRLQEWLNRIYSHQESSYAKITALANTVAALSGRITERLFGRCLLSFRFVGVSIFYALASVNLTILLSPLILHWAHTPQTPVLPRLKLFFSLGYFVAFLLLGSVPAIIERLGWSARWIWIIWLCFVVRWVIPLFTIFVMVNRLWGHHAVLRFILGVCIVIVFNCFLDIVFVTITRWTLSLASNTKRLSKVILAILLDVGLGCGVIVGPVWLGVWFWQLHALSLSIAPMMVYALKSIDFCIAVLVLIILALIGLHMAAWFVLERPIYECLRFKVIRDKKLLRGMILALIALPQIGSVWAFFIAFLKAI
jgi:hypothetical protein